MTPLLHPARHHAWPAPPRPVALPTHGRGLANAGVMLRVLPVATARHLRDMAGELVRLAGEMEARDVG